MSRVTSNTMISNGQSDQLQRENLSPVGLYPEINGKTLGKVQEIFDVINKAIINCLSK